MPPPAISTVMIRPRLPGRHDMAGGRGQLRKVRAGGPPNQLRLTWALTLRDTMFKLYYGPGTCARASHIALEEAGADYTTERLDMKNNQQNSAEYLAIN